VHLWNNIGAVVRDDGVSVPVSGLATDDNIAAHRERMIALAADLERKAAEARAEADRWSAP
jgi:hypothetical protein